ncbi:hypothetical protein KSP40_PGU015577 [Platanthera guangdongensis]|uniref:Uncharacterized protein n=1 Tax=Platanthera guangdongensis TaxID=2320717 RepID=A0ABR2LZ22_9ASPA
MAGLRPLDASRPFLLNPVSSAAPRWFPTISGPDRSSFTLPVSPSFLSSLASLLFLRFPPRSTPQVASTGDVNDHGYYRGPLGIPPWPMQSGSSFSLVAPNFRSCEVGFVEVPVEVEIASFNTELEADEISICLVCLLRDCGLVFLKMMVMPSTYGILSAPFFIRLCNDLESAKGT